MSNSHPFQMAFHRMAFKPLLYLTLWTTVWILAGAADLTLPSDVFDSVPACAHNCFVSFIDASYVDSSCGSSPSLACLCQTTGALGYTMGEGAEECIGAEGKRGVCTGNDTSTQTLVSAYGMCAGVSNAAAQTHATLVFTLAIPTGTSGTIVFATPKTTVTASVSTSTLSTAASSLTAIPTTLATASATSIVPPSSTSSTAPAQSSAASSSASISNGAIAGICIGSVAVVALIGVLIVFLARCARRRRMGDQEDGFRKMRDSWSFGGRRGAFSPPMRAQISQPIQKTPIDMDFKRPGDEPASYSPASIGFAFGGARNLFAMNASPIVATPESKSSAKMSTPLPPLPLKIAATKYVPAALPSPKPTLTLAIPSNPPKPPPGQWAGAGVRDSVVTEFAEDGEGDDGGAHIWRPPPTDPQSATTYFVADKWGNWVLGNGNNRNSKKQKPESTMAGLTVAQSEVSRTKAEREQEELAMASVPHAAPQTSQPPLAKLESPFSYRDRAAKAKALIGQQPIGVAQGGPVNATPGRVAAESLSFFSQARRISMIAKRRSKKASKRRSTDSATTIDSMASGTETEIADDEPQGDLSPVAESPRSPRSSVQYPRIPTRSEDARMKGQNLSLFPSPLRSERPQLVKPQIIIVKPHGQPSPTLGTATTVKLSPGPSPGSMSSPAVSTPVKGNPQAVSPPVPAPAPAPAPGPGPGPGPRQFSSMKVPQLNPVPNRNPGQIRTGSPDTRLGAVPPGEQQRRQQKQAQAQFAYHIPQRRDSLKKNLPPQAARTNMPDSERMQQYQHQRYPPPPQQQQQQEHTVSPMSSAQSMASQALSGKVSDQSLASRSMTAKSSVQSLATKSSAQSIASPSTQNQTSPTWRRPSPPNQQQRQQQQYAPLNHIANMSTAVPANLPANPAGNDSLLSKRLGPTRAAALALGGNEPQDTAEVGARGTTRTARIARRAGRPAAGGGGAAVDTAAERQ